MIYDCFLFNTELELLKLRLAFLDSIVDYFVIVESKRTLSGEEKILHYKKNEQDFEKYHHKIIYLEAPVRPDLSAWEYEYFQRDYLREGLKSCKDNDLILISDVDEIINLKHILSIPDLQFPVLIDLPYYYYYFNLKASSSIALNLLCNYSLIKNLNIGERNLTYKSNVKNIIKSDKYKTGWHFSYLFGENIFKYQEKIKSFSHQEFNTRYFLSEERILKCITTGIDLFERRNFFFSFKKPEKELSEILPYIKELGLTQYLHKSPRGLLLNFNHLRFIISKKLIPLMKVKLYDKPKYKLIIMSSPFRKKIKNLLPPSA